jgi:hypothetical protein
MTEAINLIITHGEVFVKRLTFDYVLLLPGQPGYNQMLRMTTELPTVGKGHPRVITDEDKVRRVWPSCPLFIQ